MAARGRIQGRHRYDGRQAVDRFDRRARGDDRGQSHGGEPGAARAVLRRDRQDRRPPAVGQGSRAARGVGLGGLEHLPGAVTAHPAFAKHEPKPVMPAWAQRDNPGSVRDNVAAADVDAARLERAIRLLRCGIDGDVGAGLELALLADEVGIDAGVGPDDDRLLAVLVLDHQLLAVNARDGGVDGGVGHGGAGPVPRPVTLAGAALRLREDHYPDRLLAAIGLRRGADADEVALLDVGGRRFDDAEHRRIRRDVDLGLALVGLDHQGRTVDAFDLADDALGLRRLRRSRRDRERRSKGRSGENAGNFHVIPPLWNGTPYGTVRLMERYEP